MENYNDEEKGRENAVASTASVSGKKDWFLPISILVAAVVIGGAVVFATFYKASPAVAPTVQNQGGAGTAAATTTPVADIMTLGPRDAILGNTNAPVTIIEYGDYQCPYCVQYFTQTQPLIVQNYVNTGKVRLVFRNFAFLDREPGLPSTENESHDAAAAAECAEDQNQFWPYHDALYAAKAADDAKGGSEDDGFYNNAEFLKLAAQVNLNIPTFTTCITSGKYAAQIDTEDAAATAAGVQSTPTFFVNGQEIQGAEPYADFQSAIEAALK